MRRSRGLNKVVLLAILGISCSAERTPFDEHRCSELRSRLVDLQVRDIHFATGIDVEAHRQTLSAALGDDFVASCLSKLDETQVDCVFAAPDQAAAMACVPNSQSTGPSSGPQKE